jgi:hypothetical protein
MTQKMTQTMQELSPSEVQEVVGGALNAYLRLGISAKAVRPPLK